MSPRDCFIASVRFSHLTLNTQASGHNCYYVGGSNVHVVAFRVHQMQLTRLRYLVSLASARSICSGLLS